MSSETKDDDNTDSDISRFTLDGVVAEMVIEVEDNEQNSPKSLKSDRLDIKKIQSSSLQESSNPQKQSDSISVSNDESGDKKSKTGEIESVDDGSEKIALICNPDNLTDKGIVVSDKITTVDELNEISKKNENLEDLEDSNVIKIVEDVKVDEKEPVKDSKSKIETEPVLEETKSIRDRKNIKSRSEVPEKEEGQLTLHPKEESKDEPKSSKLPTRSSVKKTNANESSKNGNLKRGNKAAISSKDKELPEKRLKRSSEDNTTKREKSSVALNSITSKVTLSKRLSLRPIAPKVDLTQRPSLEGDTKAISFISTVPTVDLTTEPSLGNATLTVTTIRRSRRGRPAKGSPKVIRPPKLPSRGRGRPRNAPAPTATNIRPIRNRTTPIPIRSKPFPANSTPPSIKIIPSHSRGRPTSNKDIPIAKKAEQEQIAKGWNLVPDGKLESFPEIKKQVNQAANRALRSLHHTLYGELKSRSLDAKALREEILKFKGFPFKKNSDAYGKHLSILNRMSDSTLNEIIKLLNIKKKSIPSIMAFLMKPALQKPKEIIFCVEDPYHPSMQPIVKLPKMTLENAFPKSNESTTKKVKQEKIIKKSTPDRTESTESLSNESVTSKRKRFPSTKLRFYDTDFNSVVPKKKVLVTDKPAVTSTKPKTLDKKTLASTIVNKAVIKAQSSNTATLKASAVKRAKQQAFGSKKKLKRKKLPSTMVGKDKKPISSDLQVRRKALDLAIKIQETMEQSEFDSIEENDKFNLSSFEYDTEIKEEVVTEDEAEDEVSEKITNEVSDNTTNMVTHEIEENRSENASSEVTLSSDEAKEAMGTPQKKRCYKTTAIPLKSYPSIKANITSGNYNALRRLHIVLFGSPDKAANIRGNLLSFGGFPFKQGSEEWKQKRFLLSLLPKSTLMEYLDLLAIKYVAGEDTHSLISKFMNFLAAPIENLPEDDNEIRDESEIDTDSAAESPGEADSTPLIVPAPKKVLSKVAKKMAKKPAKTKKPNVPVGKGPKGKRKVLMDEEQVRRLEADLAREQRILERERRLHEEEVKRLGLSSYKSTLPKPLSINQNNTRLKQPLTDNQTDSDLLNALLETVYQRRELKEAGAKVSIPNKGGHTRLGELANVKFLVVTANYNDLDVLHHLIYMSEATKSRVRKNILDFAGFNFAEDSPAYQDRMNFLTSLGYDISRRIAFLLGLCPYKSLIAQQDLNELIMYFLMSPCQSKQVPIRDLPNTFFGNNMPDELCALMDKHSEGTSVPSVPTQVAKPQIISNTSQIIISENGSTPTSNALPRQRAKKSFRSSLPPSERLGLTPSISTLPLATPKRPFVQPSILTPKKILLSPKGAQSSIKTTSIASQALARSIAQANAATSNNPQEFYIHQQTPDGHQKTFKLIKIPASHPLNTVIKHQTPTSVAPQPKPLTITPPVIGAPGLPPGLILFKNNPTNPALSSIMQTVPLTIGQPTAAKLISPAIIPVVAGVAPVAVNKQEGAPASADVEDSLEEKDSTIPVECNFSDEDAEELHPLEDANPPTDDELYSSIQDIIHSCASLEDITLRNVINQVSAEYPAFDLTPRHHFMKECVKKVIMGS